MGDRHESGLLLRRSAYLLLAVALAATVSLLAACGGGGKESSKSRSVANLQVQQVARDRWTYARARFREMCAGCHTLRDAGAHGRRFDLDRGGGQAAPHVRFTIEEGEPGMPAWRDVLSRREKEELVAYVSAVARTDLGGETGWLWQIRLRAEGNHWRPPGER
jgi:mono/diheme cytochrome c family protein